MTPLERHLRKIAREKTRTVPRNALCSALELLDEERKMVAVLREELAALRAALEDERLEALEEHG